MINSKELLEYTRELSILFAEDHDELRNNTSQILKNFFKTVDSVEDGEKALEIYKHKREIGQKYDLVLTDIKMPKMDGIVLTKKIYEIEETQTVIVLSAHDEFDYLLPLINLGIEQFIKKPIDYQELLSALLQIAKKLTKNNLNQKDVEKSEIYFNETCKYNRSNNFLFKMGENIYLTKYEILFLQQITQQVGKIHSNEEIVTNFMELNENIDSQNIRKLVSKLRKKLPENTLESIYGVGYRVIPFYH